MNSTIMFSVCSSSWWGTGTFVFPNAGWDLSLKYVIVSAPSSLLSLKYWGKTVLYFGILVYGDWLLGSGVVVVQ